MIPRRRFKQTLSLEERLVAHAKSLLEQAQKVRPGPERDELMRKAQQTEVALHLNESLKSPSVQQPK